jgi:hypothetical protein
MSKFKNSTAVSFVKDCFEFLSNTFDERALDIQSEIMPEAGVVYPNILIWQEAQKQRIAIACIWKIHRVNITVTGYANFLGDSFEKVVVITAETRSTELPFLIWGTPGIDFVYHVALPNIQKTVRKSRNESQIDSIKMMVDAHRLRDISDLPFDLAV